VKAFCDLTALGQARRLRPHAARVLSVFGVEATLLRQIPDATNTVFRVEDRGGRRFALRLTSPKSAHALAGVRSEIAWVRALRAESGVDVPEPIPTPIGEYVVGLTAPGLPGEWYAVLFDWVPGPMLSQRLTPENVGRHGALSARLHEHGTRFVPSAEFRIRRYQSVFPYSDPAFPNAEPIVLFDAGVGALMPPRRREVFRAACDRVEAEIDRLFRRADPQVIHNDLHVWNVKVPRGRIVALDFEDLLWGHPVQDLATTLYYYRYRPDWEAHREAFRSGYESVRAWPEARPGEIETLIAGRGILLANFLAASRDAADRGMAPEYLERAEQRLTAYLEEWA